MNLTGLAHIAILTEDLEKSISFYELLGGECYVRDSVEKTGGVNKLAMLRLAGFELEFIEPGDGTEVPHTEGAVPHFAIEVENLPQVMDELKMMGIDTFRAEKPTVRPELFGGLQNIFLSGPSGETLELIEHFSNPV